MDVLLISVAFVFGFLAHLIRLPPLVGFLVAGFVLHALGAEGGEGLGTVSELGVTLLLFSIGLKLRIKDLLRPEGWAATSMHMLLTTVLIGLSILLLGVTGVSFFTDLSLPIALLIGFALSFSSTVFAVKILEGKGEMSALHGRTAISVLIVQDLFAVIFLTLTSGKFPTQWALLLLGLPLLRPVLLRLLKKSGHGELMILFGLALALLGAELFESVRLKGDLGALVLGVMLAGTPRAEELAKSLLGFKELFLVGFFLSIGLTGTPTIDSLWIALILLLVVPVKTGLFFWLFTRFHLRARTASLSALSLSNYSEFGLIVTGVSVTNGWISPEWLTILAIVMSLSFGIAAPVNNRAQLLFDAWRNRLRPYETGTVLSYDQPIDPGNAEIIVFGMGRLGVSAYDSLLSRYGSVVLGVDRKPQVVTALKADGKNVVQGDPTDCDFWERTIGSDRLGVVVLAMADHFANLAAIEEIKARGKICMIAAVALHQDELVELKEAGASASYLLYAEAGVGLAESVAAQLETRPARFSG